MVPVLVGVFQLLSSGQSAQTFKGFTNIGTVFLIALNLDQPSKNSLTVCYDQSSGNVSGNCSAPATFACMPE